MNRRFALLAAVGLFSALLTPSLASSQAKPASTSPPAPAPAPAAPGKWVPPVKGEATVEYIQGKATPVKDGVETKFRIRNTSKGSIALLSVEEIWYNTKRDIAASGSHRHKALLNPGEVVEFTLLSSPRSPNLYTNMLMFKHANGTIKPTKVDKFK
jgi:hypothetical protein